MFIRLVVILSCVFHYFSAVPVVLAPVHATEQGQLPALPEGIKEHLSNLTQDQLDVLMRMRGPPKGMVKDSSNGKGQLPVLTQDQLAMVHWLDRAMIKDSSNGTLACMPAGTRCYLVDFFHMCSNACCGGDYEWRWDIWWGTYCK
jgi:hypothetical protein